MWLWLTPLIPIRNPSKHCQGVVLGVDLLDEKDADKILGPEKGMEVKDNEMSKINKETKSEDEEELPSWQDKPAVPEFPFGISGSGTSRYAVAASCLLQSYISPYLVPGQW